MQNNRYTPLVFTVLIAILFQAVFILLDMIDSPYKAATQVVAAYYLQDDDVLVKRVHSDAADSLDQYQYGMTQEAAQRGFDRSFLKHKLYKVHTHGIEVGDDFAVIEVTAERSSAINPLYGWVANLFGLTDRYPVAETVELAREGGQWKIVDGLFVTAENG